MRPLEGLTVLDFSTLLPGPMATLILAEAGAEVIKIERPGRGEEMRAYRPKWGADSVNFALLNRGKKSLALDLKDPADRAKLEPLLESVELGFRKFLQSSNRKIDTVYFPESGLASVWSPLVVATASRQKLPSSAAKAS